MRPAPTPRVLRLAAILWLLQGLLVGATPVSHTHAHAVISPTPATTLLDPAELGSVRVIVLDEQGAPVFARVVLRASDGVAHEALALGAEGVALSVPDGAYEIRASRGPEHSIAIERIDVRARGAGERTLQLRREVATDGYIGCDFHLHGEHSPDSAVANATRIASIAAEGLDFAVPTDHNHIASYAEPSDPTALPFGTLPGVELTTWAPSIGHFNVFPIARLPKHSGRQPDELFAELRRNPRHVIQVNHPRLDDHIAYFLLGGLSEAGQLTTPSYSLDFDVLEVWNGYDLARPERRDRVFHEWLSILAAGHHIAASGNSDSHDVQRQRPGYPRTYVYLGDQAAHSEPEAVAAALKAGRAFVTSGPLLEVEIDGEKPGGAVQPNHDHVVLEARVQAASWMHVDTLQVWGGTELLLTRPIEAPAGVAEPLDVRLAIELPIAGVPFIVVTVSGSRAMDAIGARRGALPYGFANPIWIIQNASRATRQYSATPAKDS
jgi:predicted metal-dependent phosphoesterase TrpH